MFSVFSLLCSLLEGTVVPRFLCCGFQINIFSQRVGESGPGGDWEATEKKKKNLRSLAFFELNFPEQQRPLLSSRCTGCSYF